MLALHFAAWTISCHLAVLVRGSLALAMGIFVPVVAVGWIAFHRWRAVDSRSPGRSRQPVEISLWTRSVVLAAGVGLLWGTRADPMATWWTVAAILALGTLLTLKCEDPAQQNPAVEGEHLIWALALLCGALSLVIHRPDIDDSMYLNFAVAAADAPTSALFQGDTIHGIDASALFVPAYRVHAYELLMGAVSLLTGIPVQFCFHILGAFVFGCLVPIAWAALFRELLPRNWRAATATLMVVFLLVGETHRWYSNFALDRIWQGKSILVSIMLPLVIANAIRLGRRPSPRAGLMAAASQVAAIGFSSSGLWLAPVVCFSGVASSLRGGGRKVLGIALLTTLYPIAVGLAMRSSVQYLANRVDASAAGSVQLGHALDVVLGTGALRLACLVALALAWTVTSPGLARRFAAIGAGVVWMTLLNPYLSTMVAANVTGPSYWRAMWALPVPACMTLVLVAPLRSRIPALAFGGWVVAVMAVLTSAKFLAPTAANHVRIDFPGLKVERLPFEAAAEVVRVTPAGARVAAAPEVAAWIPTFHDRPYPVMVREYLRGRDADYPKRALVTELIGTCHHLPRTLSCRPFTPADGEALGQALDDLAVRTVCLRVGRPNRQHALQRFLHDRRFERETTVGTYEVWTRSLPAADDPTSDSSER